MAPACPARGVLLVMPMVPHETLHPERVAGQQALDARSTKILARTLYRDMVKHGLGPDQILAVTTELIEHVTDQLRSNQSPNGAA